MMENGGEGEEKRGEKEVEKNEMVRDEGEDRAQGGGR